MEIIIGKTAGFCFGVANAVNKTIKELKRVDELYCLGELVHNKQVNKELEDKGLNIIEDTKDAKKNIIIRSHGATQKTYEDIDKMKLNVIDLTCPKVLKIHDIVKEYSKNGYYIILIGKSTHPEIVATTSYCGVSSKVIESEEQVKDVIQDLYNSNINKTLIIVQTTFSLEKFNNIVMEIRKEIAKKENITIEIKNTICDATKSRQDETREISSKVDMMILIGGKHSSNTNKLYDISKEKCNNCFLIENAMELDIGEIKKYNRIGIMAGASTPKKSIDDVVEMLKKIC